MSSNPVRVASLGMGWWSDVLADAAGRTPDIEIVKCFTRSEDKRNAFAEKYNCQAMASYGEILADDSIQGIINTTPNPVHLETTRAAAEAGKHVFLDKPIANTISDAKAITQIVKDCGTILSVGYQRRRESHFQWIRDRIAEGKFGKMVQAEANISRDREGKFDLTSWRYTAAGMPGGVMLQIGVHYVDVLETILGQVQSVSGMTSQLVLPGDNPDVAGLLMKHDSGAVSTLSAGYASASEYYLMNIYGKEMTAYYDLHNGLRTLKRHSDEVVPVTCEKNDAIAEELEEFAACIRDGAKPTVDGQRATESLAVILAGITSAKEGRTVDVAEILA
ncbi:MAG TPA: Gfo/Idh/MocA family oxidoreductase [Rhodospirillales bacterium]|jgi:predicted dehydrogenase|nr:MAG: scyllo-inositol 2-dehydrogenase (NAD(+)) [Alphaproteobacteria bacterium MarineAlpha3_Bin1]HIM24249.1 Gfo/Idh/MocA family oxidoreductase [Rhodospirillales bacterium]HIM77119.1 Gfo/Idh/MocA family oxidoreductase [Rhodospirillales bacterium]